MERFVNYFARRVLRRRRMVTYRSPFKKILDPYESYVWIMTSVIGFQFFDTLLSIQRFGSHSIYNYFIAAFLFIIPLWCYLELASINCTPGGLYHYTYSLANEFVGFMIGWLQISSYLTFISYISSLAGAYINEVVFDGAFDRGVKKYWFMDWGVNINAYFNRMPNVLSFFFSISVAAASCPIEIMTVVQVVCFYVITCFWMCYLMLIMADLDTDNIAVPSGKSVSTFFSSYYDIAYMYPTTFNLLYLGGDVKNAEKNIPVGMMTCFMTSWTFWSIFSLIITLSWDIQDVDPFFVLSDIAFKTGGHYLRGTVDFVAFICIITALFMYNVVLTRVVVSMAKDGLLFAVFSRIEKRTRYTAKPSLLIGIFAGVIAIFLQREFLELISKISELFLMMCAPICILLLRYTDAYHHLLRVKQETAVLNEPLEHIGITIWGLVVCVVIMGYSASQWTANFFINPHYGTSDHAYRIGITGVIFVLATILLLFQKQNHYKSPYKVPLVPFVPLVSLFIQSFMLPVIPVRYTVTIFAWMCIGLVLYFSYSIGHSKAALVK